MTTICTIEEALCLHLPGGLLREQIAATLGVYASKDDVVAIEREVRDAVDAVLPEGVWLRGDLLYTDLDDDLDDLLAEITDQVDVAAIAAEYQQERELTPISIHDDTAESLIDGGVGPRFSAAYDDADDAGDADACERMEEAQEEFAERLHTAWAAEAVRIGAEHGYEVFTVDGNDSIFPPQSRTESSSDAMGRTVEDIIREAAHDAAQVEWE